MSQTSKHIFDPHNEDSFKLLKEAKNASYSELETQRRHRLRRYAQLTGSHYGPDDNLSQKAPVNFTELAVNIFLRKLASASPKVIWRTDNEFFNKTAKAAETYQNYTLKEIRWKQTQRLWVLEGLMLMGIVKVGITPSTRDGSPGWSHDAGQVYADVVFLDDWVMDMTARSYEQMSYCGNRFQMHFADVLKEFDLTQAEIVSLEANLAINTQSSLLNEGGDPRSEALSRGLTSNFAAGIAPLLDLWELYIPREGLIVTMSDAVPNRPLKVAKWKGPEQGPYHILTYNDIPGNLVPLAPTALMEDLHTLGNDLFTKIGRQALAQKTNVGYRGSAQKDSERLRDAADNEHIRLDDPDSLTIFKQSGVEGSSLATFIQVKDLFSYFMGNLDATGGLGPQSDTLGQDELVKDSASERIADMRTLTTERTQEVMESIGDWIFHNPLVNKTFSRRIGGPGDAGINVPVKFNADIKEGDYLDFNIDILPNSMQQLTPPERLRTLTQVVTRFVIPLLPQLQEQGLVFDMEELLDIISEYSGIPELKRVVKTILPKPSEAQGEIKQSPVTSRENIRRNIPGASRQGKDAALTNVLLGAGNQDAETATIQRPSS